jgi:hypothetical protein
MLVTTLLPQGHPWLDQVATAGHVVADDGLDNTQAAVDVLLVDAGMLRQPGKLDELRRFRVAHPQARALVSHPADTRPGDPVLAAVVSLGVYDIAPETARLKEVLARRATYADAARWHHGEVGGAPALGAKPPRRGRKALRWVAVALGVALLAGGGALAYCSGQLHLHLPVRHAAAAKAKPQRHKTKPKTTVTVLAKPAAEPLSPEGKLPPTAAAGAGTATAKSAAWQNPNSSAVTAATAVRLLAGGHARTLVALLDYPGKPADYSGWAARSFPLLRGVSEATVTKGTIRLTHEGVRGATATVQADLEVLGVGGKPLMSGAPATFTVVLTRTRALGWRVDAVTTDGVAPGKLLGV